MDSTLDLKKLLISWRCEILYNLFKEEEITVEELKFIKYRHVCQLLQPYKMGIRIRFEHYLEKWRNHVGKPLKNEEFNFSADKYSCKCQHQSNGQLIKDHQTDNESPATTTNLCISSIDENLSNKRDSPAQGLESPQEVVDNPNSNTIPKPERRHILRSTNTRRPRAKPPLDLNLSDYLANALNPDTPKMRQQCPFNLAEILRKSGSKGSALIKYYDQYQEFTNMQRSQLIQIICDFFEEHEYHLSLNASHDIETEILQMFPTEMLRYYRTEKRGKLYVKYTNMKRYKRETLPYKRHKAAEERTLRNRVGAGESSIPQQVTSQGGNGENNLDTTSCDSWPERIEPEIDIKTENITEI